MSAMSTTSRISILTAVCAIVWGVNFMYDCPGALSSSLRDHLHQSDEAYQWLLSAEYTVSAVPNIALPLWSGVAVRRHGRALVLLVAAVSVLAGQTLFAVAVAARLSWLVLVGRFVFGLGSEVLSVVNYDVVTECFGDFHLNAALSILLTSGRLGSASNFLIMQSLVRSLGMAGAVWFVTIVTSVLIACGCVYCILCSSLRGKEAEQQQLPSLSLVIGILPRRFWMLMPLCVLGYACVNTFTNTAVDFLSEWFFGGDLVRAGQISSIVPILSSALVPVVGVVLELPPIQTSHVLLSSFVLMVIGHAGLLFPIFGVLLPLSCLGTAFAAFGVSFWGAVLGCLVGADDAIPVPQDDDSDRLPRMGEAGEIGTDPDLESVDFRGQSGIDRSQFSALGIGLVTSVLNAVGAISPLILAAIKNVLGYFGVELAYGFLAAFGSAICLGLS